jgi:hypothetical protein
MIHGAVINLIKHVRGLKKCSLKPLVNSEKNRGVLQISGEELSGEVAV